jgi:hypothetical protein
MAALPERRRSWKVMDFSEFLWTDFCCHSSTSRPFMSHPKRRLRENIRANQGLFPMQTVLRSKGQQNLTILRIAAQ